MILRALAAAVGAAITPPLGMMVLWAALSRAPLRFFAEMGAGGLAGFAISQQRFFLPAVLAGLAAHAVLVCLHRRHPLLYGLAFYCIGAIIYLGCRAATRRLHPRSAGRPHARLRRASVVGPMAGFGGLVFWLIAGRQRLRGGKSGAAL